MHQHDGHDQHTGQHTEHHREHGAGLNAMAVSATLHCLTGCAIGEIVGMLVGTGAGLANGATVALSIVLAFCFGYLLSTLPLLRSGLAVGAALRVVLAADTLSILTMEVVDNLVVLLIPGAMNAGLVNVVFWVSLALSLAVAFVAAYPVNRALLRRGKGHALTHEFHGGGAEPEGARRFIPSIPTGSLVAVISAFLLGGLVVSIAETLS
jgi:hypothetical protein